MTAQVVSGGACRVCSDSRIDEIEAELARPGTNKRAVARKFGLGRMSVLRHVQSHLGERLRRTAETRKAGSAAPDLLDQLDECIKFAKHAIAMANTDRSWTALNGAIGELRKTIEVIGKFRGILSDGTTVVNVNVPADALVRMAETFLAQQRLDVPRLEPVDVEVLIPPRTPEPEGDR